jgi:RHS repeat-associated protein
MENNQDSLGRLLSTVLKTAGGTTNNVHAYAYNNANQRMKQTFKDGNYLDYTYDNIGQLKTAFGKELGGTARAHEQFGYAYDKAWNLNWRTNNLLQQQFQVNNLNELTTLSRSGTLTVAGSVNLATTNITVSGTGLSTGTATRYADNSWVAGSQATLANGLNNYTSTATYLGHSAQDIASVNLPASLTCLYDLNGNITNDGIRTLEYDFENQLTNIFVASAWRSEFRYDGLGRRRVRREYRWQSSAWYLTNEVHYVYDGMLAVQERDTLNNPVLTYTRGIDLSGTLAQAGGIGGLLARTDNGQMLMGSSGAHAYYHADGNGNITCLINQGGVVVARYSYDPYGNQLGISGPLAEANSYRFSSKERHSNSGLYYYGFRFYEPNAQRWLNRDPIQEAGGLHLFRYARSAPMNRLDPFGRSDMFPPGETLVEFGGQVYPDDFIGPLPPGAMYFSQAFALGDHRGLQPSLIGELLLPSGVGGVKCFGPRASSLLSPANQAMARESLALERLAAAEQKVWDAARALGKEKEKAIEYLEKTKTPNRLVSSAEQVEAAKAKVAAARAELLAARRQLANIRKGFSDCER